MQEPKYGGVRDFDVGFDRSSPTGNPEKNKNSP